ncbi:MAG: isocitrate lyase/phosphoenolpyruvate mutase family protein [Rhodobacteraceae bacterium]|nr:isocitrate lyase/phosphoenolpyruvate mutase family protein [Paracoccaceae bacterium]
MSDRSTRAQEFRDLHVKGDPVILFNIWDPGSAKIVQEAGSKALATGSLPVALAHGFEDGEKMQLELVLDNLRRIIGVASVPVSVDLESGYGTAPETVAETVSQAVDVGAIGFNFEDQVIGGAGIYPLEEQVLRVAAARSTAGAAFLNARTDMFLKAPVESHDAAMLDQAIERAKAFEQAGADGFFIPGLADEALIETLCEQVALPVNIIALPHMPDSKTLARLGVARISYGPVAYRRMAAWLGEQAGAALTALRK